MISRREFLISVSKTASMAGVPLALSTALPDGWVSDAFGFAVPDAADNLIRAAPKARFWISTASPNVECRNCHKPEYATSGKGYAHKPAAVQCVLCAQNCVLRA